MEIKSADSTDCVGISSLVRESFNEVNSKDYEPEQIRAWTKAASARNILNRIQDRELRNFLAIEDGEIIGYVSVSTKDAIVKSLYIKPSQIGKGIGSELLKFAEMLTQDHGKTHMELNSSLTAVDFYKRKGYKETKEIDIVIEGVTIPVVKMTKELII